MKIHFLIRIKIKLIKIIWIAAIILTYLMNKKTNNRYNHKIYHLLKAKNKMEF
jgi:hypothetical protein